ncbi:MAG: methyltransferase domain-containing protein [Candidatus Hydrogenedentes bacterium]|nr:methyltransferase domain-containing protein [Candidatus Hydrogenedentota bacterium]
MLYSLRYRMRTILVRKVRKDGAFYYAYRGQLFPESLIAGNRMDDIVATAQRFCQGTGIDIGAGRWPLPGAVPIEDEPDQNAYRLGAFADGSLDYVFSSHCLEHLEHWQEALRLWIRKLRPDGVLFLYLPHESMVLWRRGSPLIGAAHKWIPTWEVLIPFLEGQDMEILEHNPARDDAWSFHIVARKAAAGPAASGGDGE